MTPPDEHESGPLRRLVDRQAGAPGDEPGWALDLIQSAPSYRPVPGRKQRLLLRFARRRRAPASLLFRVALAAGLLVGGGAVASAALGYFPGWVQRVYRRLAQDDVASSSATTPATSARRARLRDGASQAKTESPLAVNEGEPAAPTPDTGRSEAVVKTSRPASTKLRRDHDDPSLVMRAMRALRRDGDPARARALAGTYLESYPSGKLAEEALALAIEAALARGDAEAAALGARYLKSYPQGPFRDLAVRAAAPRP